MSDISWPEGEAPSGMLARARTHMLTDAVRYSHLLHVRCQPAMNDMIEQAAKSKGTRPAEYIRQTLHAGLKADGFDLALISRDAGTLYDKLDGMMRYALVSDGRVLVETRPGLKPDLMDNSFHPVGYVPRDGDAWLPIYHVDSEPFDAAIHWRLPYVTRVEADRVVREFPIVPKSLESM